MARILGADNVSLQPVLPARRCPCKYANLTGEAGNGAGEALGHPPRHLLFPQHCPRLCAPSLTRGCLSELRPLLLWRPWARAPGLCWMLWGRGHDAPTPGLPRPPCEGTQHPGVSRALHCAGRVSLSTCPAGKVWGSVCRSACRQASDVGPGGRAGAGAPVLSPV